MYIKELKFVGAVVAVFVFFVFAAPSARIIVRV